MKEQEIYSEILNGNAVLIAGSAINIGVMNHDKHKFPIGNDLSMMLYKACGIMNPDNEYDLQDASQTYQEQKSALELITFLRTTFNVGTLCDTVKTVYGLPWIRCYTTNYDEVPMLATERKMIPVTINQSTKKYIDHSNCCVYINGYIGRLNEKTLNTEFKLTTTSYMSADNILNSQWGSVLKEDLEYAKVIIIAGLSLDYDLDLKRIISNAALVEKVIFIEKQGITDDKKRKLGRFGSVWDIGVEQFAKNINQYAATDFVKQDKDKTLVCFEKNYRRYVRKPATSSEVKELLMNGELGNNLFWRNEGKYEALIYREQIYDVIQAVNNKARLIFLHANLGNGKSVFLEMLKQRLFAKGISVYTFIEEKNRREMVDVENILTETGPKVVIFDNYFNHMEVLRNFSRHDCGNITFILVARTMVYDVKLAEMQELFDIKQGQSLIFDINKLTSKDIINCYNIIEKYEFWGKNTSLSRNEKKKLLMGKRKGNCELQSILLEVINSSTIRDRLNKIVKDIKEESSSYYQSLVLMLLVKVMAIELRIEDINAITGEVVLMDTQYRLNSAVKELVKFGDDDKLDFKIKSAVVARVILNDLDNSADIIESLKMIAVYADRYSENVRYENILQNIVSFSHVKSFLNGKRDNIQFIMDYFDALKGLAYYKNNSFYWLQYSIACMWYRDYELAQNYVDVAYGKFRNSDDNVPFQCDNQQAHICLKKIKDRKSENIVTDFEKAHHLIMKPIVSEKDREEATIRLLNIYVNRTFVSNIREAKLVEIYKQYCGEAYNKVSMFLKNLRNERDRERYVDLQRKLLKASV